EIHPRMVRGLDYYERTAFEFQSDALGSQNAVAGGGRYDDLVKDLGGPSVPGVGFAIGMERLVSLVSSRFPSGEGRQKIFFASLAEAAQAQMLPFLIALRREGFETFTDYDAKSLKSLLRQADRLGADHAVIVGDEELNQKIVQVKEMKEKGEQKNIPLDSILLY